MSNQEEFEKWWSSTPILGENKRTIAEKAREESRASIEPDFYWPDGDEGGSSSVEEMAQDAYGWDGSLWEDQDIACAHELPTRTYRSFLDDNGEVQVERIK